MKKSVTVRVLCLVIASVVLSGAVAFAAITGSPYETLKKAVLDAVTYRNATVEGLIEVTVDGVSMETSRISYVGGDYGFLTRQYDETGDLSGYNYFADGLSIYPSYTSEDGTQWYCGDVRPKDAYNTFGGRGAFSVISPENRNSSEMRFVELLADVMIGDLKNNITMSSGDGVRVIRGTLTESQVPELVKAGIDMLVEQSSGYHYRQVEVSFDGKENVYEDVNIRQGEKTVTRWKQDIRAMTPEETEAWENGTFHDKVVPDDYNGVTYRDGVAYIVTGEEMVNQYTAPATRADFADSDPLQIPMNSLAINYVHGEAEVDADGNLLSADVSATATITDIFGDVHTLEVKGNVRFSDIGTSTPSCPIPGAEQLLTADYAKDHFGSEYMSVYFTLNDDDSINADSITTTYPGEMDGYVDRAVVIDVESAQMFPMDEPVMVGPVPSMAPDQPSEEPGEANDLQGEADDFSDDEG